MATNAAISQVEAVKELIKKKLEEQEKHIIEHVTSKIEENNTRRKSKHAKAAEPKPVEATQPQVS